MLMPLANFVTGRHSDTSDIAKGPLHPMPTPWKSRMAMSTPSESTNP